MSTQLSIHTEPRSPSTATWVAGMIAAILIWFAIYWRLEAFSTWIVSMAPVPRGGHLEEAARFFVFETPKVLMLLGLVVFGMGIIRSFFSPERTRAMLTGKREGFGNIAAAGLGIVTPFCSCSAVPLFVGFISAGIPLGVALSFLISAPMVNEVALGLLFALVARQARRRSCGSLPACCRRTRGGSKRWGMTPSGIRRGCRAASVTCRNVSAFTKT